MQIIYAKDGIAYPNATGYLTCCNKAFSEIYKFTEQRHQISKDKPVLESYEIVDYISSVDRSINQCDDLLTLFNDNKIKIRSQIKQLESQQSAMQAKLKLTEDYITTKSNQYKLLSSTRKESYELNESIVTQAKALLKDNKFVQIVTLFFKAFRIEVNEKDYPKAMAKTLLDHIKSYQPTLTIQAIDNIKTNVNTLQNDLKDEKSHIYTIFINSTLNILNEAILISEIQKAKEELYQDQPILPQISAQIENADTIKMNDKVIKTIEIENFQLKQLRALQIESVSYPLFRTPTAVKWEFLKESEKLYSSPDSRNSTVVLTIAKTNNFSIASENNLNFVDSLNEPITDKCRCCFII